MATDDTKFSSQSMDRRSFNDTYGMYEHIVYGYNGTSVVALRVNSDGTLSTTGLSGAGVDTTLTLTSATTAYACPAANVPASPYTLIIHNGSDTDVYCRFTTGTTGGWVIPAGRSQFLDLGANQTVFLYCASAGKIVNVSTKVK